MDDMFSTMYIKRCPKCDGDMRYISLLDYNLSIKHNIPCEGCKPYIRQCPRCNKAIKYTGLSLYIKDIIDNRQCESCIKCKPIIGNFSRNCPKCDGLITYNIKSKYDYATVHKSICKECIRLCGIERKRESKFKYGCKICHIKYTKDSCINESGVCKQCNRKQHPDYIALPQNPLDWKKTCPICNSIMTYKDRTGYRYGIKHNSKCRICQLKQQKKYPYKL